MAHLPVNLDDKFTAVSALWSPKLIAECNGQHVRIAKVRGEFIWHKHDDADELFFVVKGRLTIRLRGHDTISDITLNEGELVVVPAVSSICPSPKKNAGSCSSSPPTRSTPVTSAMSAPWNTSSASE